MKSLQQHAGSEKGTSPGLHSAVSCSHKVVLPVFGSGLTLTFSSGLREFLFSMFGPEFLQQGVNFQRLPQDIGVLVYIPAWGKFLNHTFVFEKVKESTGGVFFSAEIFSCNFLILAEKRWLKLELVSCLEEDYVVLAEQLSFYSVTFKEKL